MGRLPLPISDYVTDTKSVLDNSLRILQVGLCTHCCTAALLACHAGHPVRGCVRGVFSKGHRACRTDAKAVLGHVVCPISEPCLCQ